MPRYKLIVAYEGTDFHGWQKQHPPGEPPLRTVQGVLEEAVAAVVREPVHVLGASRTDSGVHALGQVAAFTAVKELAPPYLDAALNSRLPDDVQVMGVALVDASFNPIQDVVSKGYRYSIAHGGTAGGRRPLFDRRTVSFCPIPLDPVPMQIAADHLVGEHDFASFTRKHHGRESTIRAVHACTVAPLESFRLAIDVSGNGFLYNMVRIIAGTLLEVGVGRIEPQAIPAILAACDRTAAGRTLPPEGLCLRWIEYPSRDARSSSPEAGADARP